MPSYRPVVVQHLAYNFASLAASGDYLDVEVSAPGAYNRLASAAYAYARRHGWRCNIERIDAQHVRVWRDRPLRNTVADKRLQAARDADIATAHRLAAYIAANPSQHPIAIVASLGLEIDQYARAMMILRENGIVVIGADDHPRINPQTVPHN